MKSKAEDMKARIYGCPGIKVPVSPEEAVVGNSEVEAMRMKRIQVDLWE